MIRVGRDDLLPGYADPPIVELVLSVQFEPMPQLDVPRIGLFWSVVKDRFPQAQQQAPLAPVVESYERRALQSWPLQIPGFVPAPRVWLLDDAGSRLIQVQSDRFIYNWRKVDGSYPRYDSVRAAFVEEFGLFQNFLTEQKIGTVQPAQCEISYVNQVMPGQLWETHGELYRILAPWSGQMNDPALGDPEDIYVRTRYQFDGGNGEQPAGRVYMEAQPSFSDEGTPRYTILLTARGAPESDGLEGVLAFFDLGRMAIHRIFSATMTDEIKAVWENDQ